MRIGKIAAAAALLGGAALLAEPALAQAVVTPSGNAIGTTTGGTVVELPVGEYVAGIQSALSTIMTVAITALMAYLPFPIRWVLNSYGAQNLARDAVNIGINATVGAKHDAVLNVDVGSKVLAKALNYFVQQGGPKYVKALGGVDALTNKLIGMLHLESGADIREMKSAVASVADSARR